MKNILSYWQLDISSMIIMVIILAIYMFSQSYRQKQTVLPFAFANVLMILCFFSPLSILSQYYLFSAHMAVHVLLLLIVGPLLLVSFNRDNKRYGLFHFFAQYPLLCWMAGVGIMWLWHIPVVFNNMMHMPVIYGFDIASLVENSSLLLAGILFSLPVLSPKKTERVAPLSGVLYLFTACVGCSILGLLITFAPTNIYHHYLAMNDIYSWNNIIATQWQMNKSIDQQIAGLIMWVPCCLVYVAGSMYLLIKWFNGKETGSVNGEWAMVNGVVSNEW